MLDKDSGVVNLPCKHLQDNDIIPCFWAHTEWTVCSNMHDQDITFLNPHVFRNNFVADSGIESHAFHAQEEINLFTSMFERRFRLSLRSMV